MRTARCEMRDEVWGIRNERRDMRDARKVSDKRWQMMEWEMGKEIEATGWEMREARWEMRDERRGMSDER